MQTSLLTLNSTSVAGQEASLLQRRAISRVVDIQGTRNGKAKSTSLTGGATAGEVCMDVELTFTINQYQRRLDQLLVQFVREVIFQGQKVLIGLGKATKSEPSSSSTQPTEPQKPGTPGKPTQQPQHLAVARQAFVRAVFGGRR